MITGVTFGAFDLLHAGHVMFLTEAKRQCEMLAVGLHIDPSIERPEKNKPVQSVLERHIQLEGLASVDSIIPYETEKDLDYILSYHQFNKRFLGSEYMDAWLKCEVGAQKICRRVDTKIVFIPRFHNFSSTSLRERVLNG